MATLSKHGTELLRVDLLRKSISYRSDGSVLFNSGDGWKLGKLKPGLSIEQAVQARMEGEEKLKRERPAFVAYREAVQNEFPLSVRWKYLTLVDIMPDDLDGVWAELADAGMHCDIETLQDLRDLKRASAAEFKASKGENL